jgi:tetratricopeptide (TPR) repeat protein
MRFPGFRSASSTGTLACAHVSFKRFCTLLVLCSAYLAASPCGTAAQQTPPSRAGQPNSRSQKVANPLNDLLNEAQHDVDTGAFEAGIAPLQKFIAEKPDVAYAHFQLAYIYTALHRPEEARPEYERTIALDPKMSEAYLNLGLLLSEHEPSAAIAPLRKAVELLPAQSRPRTLLGTAQERSGDLTGAADSFEGAVHLDPQDTDAVLHLAILYFNLKRFADAEPKFRAVLDAKPDSVQAARGLAESLEAEKKPEAADAWRKYLALQPDDTAVRARIVHFLVDQENYDEAIAELDRVEAGKTPTADSLRLRADILIAQKKFDDAIVTLKRALALAPNDLQLLTGLGRLYMQKRDFVSAEKAFQSALKIDQRNLVVWKNLSSTYYLAGNCPAALGALDVIAKAESPNAASWFIRALCYDTLHQLKPALEAYQKFLSLDEGKNPDQVWQAQQRSKVLMHQLEEKRR